MYLAEVNAVRLVNLLETIQTAPSLNALAWVVISELDTWFEWCHADDTEARLVLLSEGGVPGYWLAGPVFVFVCLIVR